MFLTSAMAFSLAACVSVASYEEASEGARKSLRGIPDAWTTAQENVGAVEVGWIDAFEDETLIELVKEAQANNKDLQVAAANVELSHARARKAGAVLKPQINLTAGGSESGIIEGGTSNTNLNVGLQANWELDVWGRIRSGRQAATISAQAAEADFLFAQYSLAAGVARAYFLGIEARLQERIAINTAAALQETTNIVDIQFKNGLASSQDLALTKSDLATANSTLAATRGARREALRALEVLLGRYPEAEVKMSAGLPLPPPSPPPGIPSEILERRPDIVAAERRVAAAFNQVSAAKAAKMPRIALTSSIGGASNDLSDILDPANVAWNVAGNLLAPLFDGGLRQVDIDAATAEQKQAIATYEQAALEAFREVESNLDQGVILDNRIQFLKAAADQANEAYRVARLRYEEGETDLIDVLTIQRRLFAAESNLASVQRQLLEQRIILNLALGGSWN
jgi:NodT family efflux transporter outer membrane factor (OMF) lipoprotein